MCANYGDERTHPLAHGLVFDAKINSVTPVGDDREDHCEATPLT